MLLLSSMAIGAALLERVREETPTMRPRHIWKPGLELETQPRARRQLDPPSRLTPSWEGKEALALLREPDPSKRFDIDLDFLEKPEEEPPKNCEVWLLNDDTVEGFFVLDLLMEVFDLPRDRAFSTMQSAHSHGQGLVLITECNAANGMVDKAKERAASEYPQLEFLVEEVE